ncbi:MAG: DUF1320 domain-containing protein [bacterium]
MMYCTLSDLKEQMQEDDLIQLTDDRSNLASGTLAGEIDAAETGIILTDASRFSESGGRIEIDSEQIDYTEKIGNQLTGCVRGVNKTTAAPHQSGTAVTELNTISTSVIERAIADAGAEIDSYCAARYTNLPFTGVPVMIRKISVDITLYNLYARRKGAPDERRDRYISALKFLENVARGVVSLGADAPDTENYPGPMTTGSKRDRIFSMGRISDASSGTLDNY